MAFLQVERNLLPVQTEMPDGTIVSLKFFPSQIEIVSDSTPSAWQGRVEEVMNLGDRVQLVLSVGDNLFAKIEIPIPCRYRVGDRVEFIVKGSVSPAGGDDKGNNQSG